MLQAFAGRVGLLPRGAAGARWVVDDGNGRVGLVVGDDVDPVAVAVALDGDVAELVGHVDDLGWGAIAVADGSVASAGSLVVAATAGKRRHEDQDDGSGEHDEPRLHEFLSKARSSREFVLSAKCPSPAQPLPRSISRPLSARIPQLA